MSSSPRPSPFLQVRPTSNTALLLRTFPGSCHPASQIEITRRAPSCSTGCAPTTTTTTSCCLESIMHASQGAILLLLLKLGFEVRIDWARGVSRRLGFERMLEGFGVRSSAMKEGKASRKGTQGSMIRRGKKMSRAHTVIHQIRHSKRYPHSRRTKQYHWIHQ